MRNILLGLGYLTWLVCNIAVIYGIGYGAMKLIELESMAIFLGHLALGLLAIMVLLVVSILCLGLVAIMFNDEKVIDKVEKWFPFLDI
jgi:hypothetical protein